MSTSWFKMVRLVIGFPGRTVECILLKTSLDVGAIGALFRIWERDVVSEASWQEFMPFDGY